jgi:gluconolactonase
MTAWMTMAILALGAVQGETAMTAGPPQQVATGFKFTEGPLWLGKEGLVFSDIPADTICRLDKSAFRTPSNWSNGLTLDRERRLIACETTTRRITRTEKDGTITVVAEKFEEHKLNGPNDVVVRSDGMIFFTDPPYGLPKRLQDPAAELDFSGVFAVKPGEAPRVLGRDFVTPNGLALSPDEKTLYVSDTERNHIRAFDLASDGNLSNSREFYGLPVPDGIKVDPAGNAWCSAKDGVHVIGPDGKRLELIGIPEASNCAFGDDDAKALYVAAGPSIFKVRLKSPGILPGPRH